MPFWSLFVPTPGRSNFCKCLKGNGGDDETRTRDLCRDELDRRVISGFPVIQHKTQSRETP